MSRAAGGVRPRVLRLLSRCAYTNLATEEALFAALAPSARLLLFYQNGPAVVLGRTQNPFHEADLAHAGAAGAAVLRRRSGGGTVVHDAANLNVSFLAPADAFDPPGNVSRVADALARLGIPRGVFGGGERGDITVRGRKVSGSAYRFSGGRSYHHATLLVDSDLGALRRCLRSGLRGRLAVSGAASVRSEVTNLADEAVVGGARLGVEDVLGAVAGEFGGGVVEIGENLEGLAGLVEDGAVEKERDVLRSREWVYGQCPRFSARFRGEEVGGGGDVVVFMAKGCVVQGVQRVGEAEAQEVEVGFAPGKGSLGDGDGRLEWAEAAGLLEGRRFCGSEFAQAARGGSGEAAGVLARIAPLVPEQHVC